MPLADHIPNIDDRSYDSIVAEMRTRIARYTPEWKPVWTDLNDSDPGITLLQVFAWLAEMLAYRMNQVPELNYLKFLQLLGIELRPAEPAEAEITFPVLTDASRRPTVIVPQRHAGHRRDRRAAARRSSSRPTRALVVPHARSSSRCSPTTATPTSR